MCLVFSVVNRVSALWHASRHCDCPQRLEAVLGAGVNPLSSGSLGHKHGFPGLETAKHAVSVRGHGGVIEFSDEGREWSIVGE